MKTINLSELNKLLTDYSRQEKDVKPLFLFFPSDDDCQEVMNELWGAVDYDQSGHFGFFFQQPIQLANRLNVCDDEYCYYMDDDYENPLNVKTLDFIIHPPRDNKNPYCVYFFAEKWLQEEDSAPVEYLEEHFDLYNVTIDTLI